MAQLSQVKTYPSRIWDGQNFVENVNREQSSDTLTTVAVKQTNEVLGFKDGTDIHEMENVINGDLHGTISEYRPTFYQKHIRDPLSNLGVDAFQPKFITDIKPSAERAFVTSFARGATADIVKPIFSEKEAKAFPAQAMAGQLAGTLVGFKGLNVLLEGIKLPQFAKYATDIITKQLGAGKAAEVASKAIPATIQGGVAGGAYRGVSETATEIRDSDHPEISKIGKAVLHDTLWWGGIAGVVGPTTKSVGVAASAGLGYLMGKADGASEPDALLNGGILAGFHLFMSHSDKPKVREFVVNQTEQNLADYVKAKNPLVDDNIAQQTAREMIFSKAEEIANAPIAGEPIAITTTPEQTAMVKKNLEGKAAVDEVLKSPEATQKMMESIGNDVFSIEKPKESVKQPIETAVNKMEFIDQALASYDSALAKGDPAEIQKVEKMIEEKAKSFTPEEQKALADELIKAGGPKETLFDIPKFNNPNEAHQYGKSATPEQIQALRDHYVELQTAANDLRIKENKTDVEDKIGFSIAEQLSRVREALAATGKPEAYKGIFTDKKAEAIRQQDIANEKNNIPDMSKQENTTQVARIYGDSIKDNPKAIKEVKNKIKEMEAKVKKAIDTDDPNALELAQTLGKYKEIIEALPPELGGVTDKVKRASINETISNKQSPPIEPPPENIPSPGSGKEETKVRGLSKGVEEKAIENKLTQGFGDLPQYETINMKEQAQKASDLLNKDYELSKRIALGQEPVPKGILPESIFVAVENRAINEGDVNTLRDLATNSQLTTEATTMGQRIRTLAERNPESPIKAIQELQKAREERFFKEQEKMANRGKIGRLVEKMGKIIKENLSMERKSVKDLRREKRDLAKEDRVKTKNLVDKIGKEIYKELKSEKKKIVSEIKSEISKVNTKENWDSFIKSLEC